MKAELVKKLDEIFKYDTQCSFTIIEENDEKKLIKYIKEFDQNQVPYFIVRINKNKKKFIQVFNNKLEIVSEIT
jgi:hypothetical protein